MIFPSPPDFRRRSIQSLLALPKNKIKKAKSRFPHDTRITPVAGEKIYEKAALPCWKPSARLKCQSETPVQRNLVALSNRAEIKQSTLLKFYSIFRVAKHEVTGPAATRSWAHAAPY